MQIEIDQHSGFCFGVTRAIGKAEEELQTEGTLFCLGDIVHNGRECERLQKMGLKTINHEQLHAISHAKVLLRAHGEPPSTYETAEKNSIEIIDATCPVVLHLQKRIKTEYEMGTPGRQIVIFGERGHAEVLGLVGQTEGHAIVIETLQEAETLDFSHDICLYSQTTKPLDEFRLLVAYIEQHMLPGARFTSYDTICRQVANQIPHIREFATRHDAVLFVCGKKSSNGRVLFSECRRVRARSFLIESPQEIDFNWFDGCQSVGICGATSTPRWLMEECKSYIEAQVTK